MTAEKVLTLCVGISGYDRRLLEPGEQPLEYLGSGAQQLSDIFRRAWASEGSRHLVKTGADATLSHVTASIEAEKGSYDLFVLYLGGHGRLKDGEFQFLFAPEATGKHLASSGDIDAIMRLVDAKHALLFLDACHAARYIEQTNFFRSVGADRARVCLASSLPDQSSWEDSYFKRSLFAEGVIKALTVPSEAALSTGPKRVEFAFDEISGDVVRHAFALKRSARQEPAMGGALTVPLWLPITIRPVAGREAMTTYQTLLRRSRQIAVAAAVLAVIAACGVSAATWRPALNGSGLVEIRPGPKWLSPMNVGPWRLRVETEASIADLKDENDYPSVRAEIRDEEGLHAWPGNGSSKVRRWADYLIDEQLSAAIAARWRVRLGYADAVEKLKAPGHILATLVSVPLSSGTRLAAEAKALAPGGDLSDVWSIQWKQALAPGSCDASVPSSDQKNQLSFYLSSEPADIVAWLRGLALTARVDSAVDLEAVVSLVKMFSSANRLWKEQYSATLGAPGEPITGASISARFNERPTPAEISALAAVATAIVEHRIERKVATVTPAERSNLIGLMTGCAEFGVHALAAVGAGGDPARVVQWAHGRKRADQGRIPLLLLASQGALPPSEVAQALMAGGFGGDASDRKRAFVYVREWLSSVADVAGLSPELLHGIVDYAEQRKAARDDTASRDAEILLARCFGSLPSDDRARVAAMLAPAEASLTSVLTSQETVERLGLLASTKTPLTAAQRSFLMRTIEGSKADEPSRVNFVDADRTGREDVVQLVPGLTSTHLLAFSRFVAADGKDGVLRDPRTVPFLEQAIADGIRSGVRLALLRTVLAAAATARGAADGALDAGRIVQRLRVNSDDAAKRLGVSAIAIAQMSSYPAEQRASILSDLRDLWSAETEPEIKLSLAATIIGTISPSDAVPRPNR